MTTDAPRCATIEPLRTLFLMRDAPYPPRDGAMLRNWQNVNIMMRHGPVGVFSIGRRADDVDELPGVQRWQHVDRAPRPFSSPSRARLQALTALVRPAEFPHAHETPADLGAQVDAFARRFAPDLIILEGWMYRPPAILGQTNAKVILDAHNVESVRARETDLADERLRSRVYARLKIARLVGIERSLVKRADQVWVCSTDDLRRLATLGEPVDHAHVIPNGIDLGVYEPVRRGACVMPAGTRSGTPTVCFVGLFSYGPNAVAAEWLVREIMPAVRRRVPECRLLLVGRGLSETLRAEARAEPGIVLAGEVADVRPYLAAATVVAVPLIQGGGTRLKILEAFAAGRPVVSTRKGAEGLRVTDGRHLLVRDDVGGGVDGIAQIIQHPELARTLARNALELVAAEYSWDAIGEKVQAAIAPLARTRAALASPRRG